MNQRYNEVNNSGVLTISGGNMPANIYTNNDAYASRVSGQGNTFVIPTVTANGHAVEQAGDGGCWDTVSSIPVDINTTNIGAINL
jgi:hypothetical protein